MTDKGLSFQDVLNRTTALIREFEKVEKRPWGIEGAMIELQKQVGELSKQIMAFEGYYIPYRDTQPEYKTSKERIADELSDILIMVIRIADHYKIDLEKEHLAQIDIARKHPAMDMKKRTK